MILVSVHRLYPECRILLHCRVDDLFEFNEYIWFEYLPSVLCTPDDMILMLICGVIETANPHGISLTCFEAQVMSSNPPPSKVRSRDLVRECSGRGSGYEKRAG